MTVTLSFNSSAQKINKIDKLLIDYNAKDQFNGVVLLAHNGEIVFNRPYGLANRQFDVSIKNSTRFPIASITKFYTAIILLKLQEKKLIDIDACFGKYIPQILPSVNSNITIRQLLTHSSGLNNESVAAYNNPLSILEFIEKNVQDSLQFKPGSRYKYNNLNYVILGAVIEAVTKKRWENVFKDLIIDPLKLQNTGVITRDAIIKNLAYGYYNYSFGSQTNLPLKNDPPIYLDNYSTAGAIFANTGDLLTLDIALEKNIIISEQSKKTLYQPEKQLGPVDDNGLYTALGIYIGEMKISDKKTVKVIERDGNINSFNAVYVKLPDYEETLIILCNTDSGDLTKIKKEIIDILVNK